MGRARDIANIINSGTFITPTNASATYLSQISASSTYLPLTGGNISGNVTTPNRPYFRAWANTATNTPNVINYDTAIINIGNHYNTTTKRFTAPINGVYYFEAHFLTNRTTTTGDSGFDFRINGGAIKRVYDQKSGGTNNHVEASGTLLVYLTQGQTVDVHSYGAVSGVIIANDIHCQFAGMLIG
jgi:hypothetical protein